MITEPDPGMDLLAKLVTLYDTSPFTFSEEDGKVLMSLAAKIENTVSPGEEKELERLWDAYATQ